MSFCKNKRWHWLTVRKVIETSAIYFVDRTDLKRTRLKQALGRHHREVRLGPGVCAAHSSSLPALLGAIFPAPGNILPRSPGLQPSSARCCQSPPASQAAASVHRPNCALHPLSAPWPWPRQRQGAQHRQTHHALGALSHPAPGRTTPAGAEASCEPASSGVKRAFSRMGPNEVCKNRWLPQVCLMMSRRCP